ncbi:MAG: hypothetical protein ACYTE6_11870 [Planctomycetota bacterium]|jgi:hypothetical protein
MSRPTPGHWVLAAMVIGWGPPVGAEPVQGVRCRVTEPIAVRGGVLMVPLEARRGGDGWPQGLELSPVGGGPIAGVVAWIHPAPPPEGRRWTDDPRSLAVRRIEPTDDTSVTGTGSPYLLARLPRDGGGPLRVGEQTLYPRWRDRAGSARLPGWSASGALELASAPDRPDPDSPFEYWRWVLLAERMGLSPPSNHAYGALAHLVAEHYADVWRLGLARLHAINPGASARCCDLLTGICLDGEQPFAAWVIDPVSVSGLLAILLNFERPDAEVAEAAREWADLQDVIVMRVAPPEPGVAALAVANPLGEPISVRFTWLGSKRLARAVTMEPGKLTRVSVSAPAARRPPGRADLSRREADVQVLVMDAAGRQRRLTFRVGDLPARPPGFVFTPLRPPLTLAEAQAGWQRVLPADRSTTAQFRKLNRRWELFVECRRPGPSEPSRAPAFSSGVEDARGIEAVTVLLGGKWTGVGLTVPETGWHSIFLGDHDGTLEVHRRSYHDRWFCRIVLPDEWLQESGGGPARIGLVRTHGDSESVETAPYPALPWRLEPGRADISLDTWDALPDVP